MTSNSSAEKSASSNDGSTDGERPESPEIDIGSPEPPDSPTFNQLSPKENDFVFNLIVIPKSNLDFIQNKSRKLLNYIIQYYFLITFGSDLM